MRLGKKPNPDTFEGMGQRWGDPQFRQEFLDVVIAHVKQRLIDEIETDIKQREKTTRKTGNRDGKVNLFLAGLRHAVAIIKGEA